MAFQRKFVRSVLEDESLSVEEKVARIIGGHMETVDALNDTIASLKGDSTKLADAQKELDDLKASQKQNGDWESKYKAEHADFESYKQEQQKAAGRNAKVTALKPVLSKVGINENLHDLIIAASQSVIDGIELDDAGAIKEADKLEEKLKKDYSKYISETDTHGAHTPNPPGNSGGKKTKADILKIKDTAARQKAIAENLDLFR